jgi:hypothetical protein
VLRGLVPEELILFAADVQVFIMTCSTVTVVISLSNCCRYKIVVIINIKLSNVRFEVFTTVTMKNGVFWDVMPCGACKNRRFRGT